MLINGRQCAPIKMRICVKVVLKANRTLFVLFNLNKIDFYFLIDVYLCSEPIKSTLDYLVL